MTIQRSILILLCGLTAALLVHTVPFYSLPDSYYFDGTLSTVVNLSNLVCVKGNKARSIQFQMMTTHRPTNWFGLIGMACNFILVEFHTKYSHSSILLAYHIQYLIHIYWKHIIHCIHIHIYWWNYIYNIRTGSIS